MECYHERAFYYWRHGYYGHVQLICSHALKKTNNDIFLHVWNSLSLGVLGKTEIALKQISQIECRSDLSLLLSVSQLCIIKKSSNKDQEKINELQKEIEKQIKKSNKFCISQSAQVAWMFNDIDLSNKILKYTREPIAINGWIKLTNGDYSSAEKIFDSILHQHNKSDLLSLYGKYIILLATSKSAESTEIYNQITTQYNFPEINVEKARISAQKGRYDQALTILKDYEAKFPTTIEIDIFASLTSIIKYGDLYTATKYLEKICQICEKIERINWKLTSKLALVFVSLSGQDLSIINQTIQLSHLSLSSNPTSPICLQITALHHIITRNYGVAQSILKSIDFNDEKCTFVNFNSQLILMKVFHQDKELEDALDLYDKTKNNFFISTYRSYLSRRKNQESFEFFQLILNDIKTLLNSIHDDSHFFAPLEIKEERFLDIFIKLRLEVLFDSFDEIVVLNNSVRTQLTGQIGDEIKAVISEISNYLHGYIPLLFVQAVLLFKQSLYFESECLFRSILISKWKYRISEILIYLARIDMINNKAQQAKIKIDEAFSLNDQLRNDYNFHLIRTEIYQDQQHLVALLPYFQDSSQPFSSILKFLDLAISLKSFTVATQIYQAIKLKAKGSSEKGSLVIRKAKILAGSKLFDESFELLEKLKNHSNFIDLATLTESEIRYKYKIGSFIECLKKLHESKPSSKHSEMIGDAYVKAIDFVNAAKWYKTSIEYQTPNPDTFQKYIKALMSCHRFDEAVLQFTEHFSKAEQNTSTLIFLLKELIKIERFKEAQKCISNGIHFLNKSDIVTEADFFCQSGIVSWKLNDFKMARKYFKKASAIYDNIFMYSTFQSIYLNELKEQASLFFISYARFCQSQNRTEKASDLYARAIELDESNQEPVIALVKYYKSRYEVHKCIRLCTEFLKRYPNNERVALELTTVDTSDHSSAIKCLTRVLKVHPKFYRILIRLIEICARAGRLNDVAKMITKDSAPGMILARGLFAMYNGLYREAISIFSKIQDHPVWGMAAQFSIVQILVNPDRKYCWCTNEPLSNENDLIKASEMIDKMARPKKKKKKNNDEDEDLTYEIDPIYKVLLQAEVEIARNTLTSISNASSLYNTIIQLQDDSIQKDTTEDNLKRKQDKDQNQSNNMDKNESDYNSSSTINNLNTNNSNTNNNNSNNSNSNITLNGSSSNNNISSNIIYNSNSKFILNQSQYIAALVGLARCEIRLRHPNQAINLITEVLKRKPYHETFSFFEEAYLMRAQLYLDEGNNASAQHFYLLTLQLNMSCKKAWEMNAMLYKKNKMYKEAADAFKHCWELSGKKNIEAGYEFALCSMKANQPEDALEMCRLISETNPIFKNLRENILIPSFRKLKH